MAVAMVRALCDAMAQRSQYRTTMYIDDPADSEQVARFARRMTDRAAEHGSLAEVAYGERFKLLAEL